MHLVPRFTIGAAVAAGVMLVAFAGAALAVDPSPTPMAEPTPGPIETLTGVIDTRVATDGDTQYVVGTTELSIGPAWFWGTKNPLTPYVGKSVTVTGRTETGTPPAKTGTTPKVSSTHEFEVLTVNGTTVRAEGKPPWAGGPKVVGVKHPGYVHP